MTVPDITLGCSNLVSATLPELIEAAAGAGFRSISARPFTFHAALRGGASEADLRAQLSAAGVSVTMVDALTQALPGTTPPDQLDPALRASLPPEVLNPPDEEAVFRAAEALGAPTVNVTHFLGNPTPEDDLADALAAICRRAGERGLQIAIEPIPGTGIATVPMAQTIIERCGEPNCGITLDFFHLDRSGGSADDVRQLPPGAISCVQLTDRVPPRPDEPHVPMTGRCLPGLGVLPLDELVRASFDNSPDAWFEIEVLNAELSALPPSEAAVRLAEAARSWLATAFEHRA